MNRLLTIIENNQQSMQNNSNMNMGYSLCSHMNKQNYETCGTGSSSHSLNHSFHP